MLMLISPVATNASFQYILTKHEDATPNQKNVGASFSRFEMLTLAKPENHSDTEVTK